MLAFDCALEFDASHEADFFAALPQYAGVVLIEPREKNAEPYLIRTASLRRRLERLLGPSDSVSKRLNLREFAYMVRYRLTGSRFEQALAYYQHAKQLFPRRYQALARLQPAAVLKVNLTNAYPRCYVTRKIRTADSTGLPVGGIYYGPFASRHAADAFAEKFLDLFKIRRCQIKIRRDPAFPGCIYSEMKMCLAPCFAGCTNEQYAGEVQRVVSFLDSSGASLIGEIERERGAASEGLDFERAAALHKRLDKVNDVLRDLPDLPRKIDQLDAVILQRAAEDQTVSVFAVHGGRVVDPFFLRFAELASHPRSVEEILRTHLEPRSDPADPSRHYEQGESQSAEFQSRAELPSRKENVDARLGAEAQHDALKKEDLGEHLALIARWFYSKPREGEIFFRQADWPYRRILRACSRVLAPPAAPPSSPAK